MSQDSTNTPTPDAELAKALALVVFSAVNPAADPPVRYVDQYGARVVGIQEAVTLACDAILAAGWRPPADDTEFEWAVRVGDGELVHTRDRATTDGFMTGYGPTGVVVRRCVGPWEEQS